MTDKGGRPEIGPAINVRIPRDLLVLIDARVSWERPSISRAEWIRRALTRDLARCEKKGQAK